MDDQIAASIELAVRTRLFNSLTDEFGNLHAAVKALGIPSAKTYRHLDPSASNSTKKIPLADIVVIAEKLHGYDPARFPSFSVIYHEAFTQTVEHSRV